MAAVNLLDFDLAGLAAYCDGLGEKRFRAQQLFRWLHQKGEADFTRMSDLARSLRDKLAGVAEVRAPALISEQASADGTVKWLFDVGQGNAVETVFIPEDDRGTLCISSQAGCAVGCRFCSTGHQGFSRNLSTGRDRRPAVVCRTPAARAAAAGRRRTRHQQRGDDGHGRAAAELCGAAAGAARDARRPCLRPVAAARHRLHLGRGADDRPAARRLPGGAGGVAACAQRCAARRAGAAEPQVPAGRAAGRPARATWMPRRATSSRWSTACCRM